MAITLRDFFDYLRERRARLVIWRQVITYLQNEFVSTDADEAASKLTLDSGEEISEEEVEEVIDAIFRDHVAPLQKTIVELMDTELDEKLNQLRSEKREERSSAELAKETPPPKLRKRKSK